MSFVKNDNQQLTLLDSTFNLTDREKRMLEKSWAKTFADKVFPAIDENIFSVLYSEKASRPNTPVNVIVGALILKEALNVTDDEIVEAMAFDICYCRTRLSRNKRDFLSMNYRFLCRHLDSIGIEF